MATPFYYLKSDPTKAPIANLAAVPVNTPIILVNASGDEQAFVTGKRTANAASAIKTALGTDPTSKAAAPS